MADTAWALKIIATRLSMGETIEEIQWSFKEALSSLKTEEEDWENSSLWLDPIAETLWRIKEFGNTEGLIPYTESI